MSKLTAKAALSGYSKQWDGLSVDEIIEYELVSLSIAHGAEAQFSKAIKKSLGCALPAPAKVIPAGDGSVMWTAPGQYLAMLSGRNDRADQELQTALGESGYAVLQSDGWAVLRLEGPRLFDVLERFIALDLRGTDQDFAARTSAHHMAVIVVKLLDGSWLLVTPRSSAKGFAESLDHVANHVLG